MWCCSCDCNCQIGRAGHDGSGVAVVTNWQIVRDGHDGCGVAAVTVTSRLLELAVMDVVLQL